MCYECDRYNDYNETVNFYYAFSLIGSFDVSKDREFAVGELIAIENSVYSVSSVKDINDTDGNKIARAVNVSKVGPFENLKS